MSKKRKMIETLLSRMEEMQVDLTHSAACYYRANAYYWVRYPNGNYFAADDDIPSVEAMLACLPEICLKRAIQCQDVILKDTTLEEIWDKWNASRVFRFQPYLFFKDDGATPVLHLEYKHYLYLSPYNYLLDCEDISGRQCNNATRDSCEELAVLLNPLGPESEEFLERWKSFRLAMIFGAVCECCATSKSFMDLVLQRPEDIVEFIGIVDKKQLHIGLPESFTFANLYVSAVNCKKRDLPLLTVGLQAKAGNEFYKFATLEFSGQCARMIWSRRGIEHTLTIEIPKFDDNAFACSEDIGEQITIGYYYSLCWSNLAAALIFMSGARISESAVEASDYDEWDIAPLPFPTSEVFAKNLPQVYRYCHDYWRDRF